MSKKVFDGKKMNNKQRHNVSIRVFQWTYTIQIGDGSTQKSITELYLCLESDVKPGQIITDRNISQLFGNITSYEVFLMSYV